MTTPSRKKRRLLDDTELEEVAPAGRVQHKETPKYGSLRSLSDLLPVAPTPPVASSSRESTKKAPNGSVSSFSATKGKDTPNKSTSSTSLLRSALRNGPSSFPASARKVTSMLSEPHEPSPLRPALPDPFLGTIKKPPDRNQAVSVTARAPQLAHVAVRTTSETKEGEELKPAKLELALAMKPEEPPIAGAKAITEHVPTLDKNSRTTDSYEELSSPRKRKGGGLLANGLAQQAIEVLNRTRTDHALWQHALSRRISTIAPSETPLSTLRQAAEPDLRLRILSVLPGFPATGPRLVARCAILNEDYIPSSAMDEFEEQQDMGIVVFSLSMHPSLVGGPPSRARSRSEAGAPSLLVVNNAADLLVLEKDVEVWVYEPWSEVSLSEDGLSQEQGRKALICTRFAAVRS